MIDLDEGDIVIGRGLYCNRRGFRRGELYDDIKKNKETQTTEQKIDI